MAKVFRTAANIDRRGVISEQEKLLGVQSTQPNNVRYILFSF